VGTYGVELPEHEAHNTFILMSNLKMREIGSTYQTSLHGVVLRVIVINYEMLVVLNLLKPTGYVMHQQFNIQQLYALLTLYLCVLYLSENKQRVVPLTS